MKSIDPNGLMLSLTCVFLTIIIFHLVPWAVENLKDAIGNLRRNKLMNTIGNMGENVPMTKMPSAERKTCDEKMKSLGSELHEIRDIIGELERATDELNYIVTGNAVPYDPIPDPSSMIMDVSNLKFRLLRVGQSLRSIKEGLGD